MAQPAWPMIGLSDGDIADKIHAARQCPLCREQQRPAGGICWTHHDELGRMLDPDYLGERDLDRAASIPVLYERLDPSPTMGGEQERRAPGFGSVPPCNLTIVAMRDDRSRSWPVVEQWFECGPDGRPDVLRPHGEDEHPPRAVEKSIAGIVEAVWEDLGVFGPLTVDDHRILGDVTDRCGWLYDHLHELTARDDADNLYRDILELHDQLRPAAGDPKPRPIGECTGWIWDHAHGEKIQCEASLYMPPPQPGVTLDANRPVLRCRRCDRPYTMLMLLRLEIGAEREAS